MITTKNMTGPMVDMAKNCIRVWIWINNNRLYKAISNPATKTITISKLYTYPCPGTGGHTEYVCIHGNGVNASATWNGYQSTSDYHLIEFAAPVTLEEGVTYDYTIRTGSYPQIHHSNAVQTATGWLNCTEFADVNGRIYYDWIPAIRLFS